MSDSQLHDTSGAPAGASSAAPAPAGAPVGRPAPPEPRGTAAWALGFLAYIPIPFVNMLVSGAVQLFVGLAQRKHGGLAAVNGVRAANWGLIQLCYLGLFLVTAVLYGLTGDRGLDPGLTPHNVAMVAFIGVTVLYFVLALMQLIYSIVGTVQAAKGQEVRLPVIPFVRARRG